MLSSLFMYTLIGLGMVALGAVIAALHGRWYGHMFGGGVAFIGAFFLLSNPSSTAWDLMIAVGFAVLVALGTFMVMTLGACLGLIDASLALSLAMRLGVIEMTGR